MIDKETYYKKKMKTVMLNTVNMVVKTEEAVMRRTSVNNDLSVAEIHTLVAVGRHQPKTMGDIASELLINVSTLSIAIKKLEKKGFVRRLRTVEDRRVVRIELTERGDEALAYHEKFYLDLAEEAMANMDEAEKKAHLKLMERLMQFFENKLLELDEESEKEAKWS